MMSSGELSRDLRQWTQSPLDDYDVLLPEGTGPCIPCLEVIAITEASALPSPLASPKVLRCLYGQYEEGLVWAGFNAWTRICGSKLLLGAPADFSLLRELLVRLKVWHIDQQYKAFQNNYFTVVYSKLHIVVGCRDHVSGCNKAVPGKSSGITYMPSPVIDSAIDIVKMSKCVLVPMWRHSSDLVLGTTRSHAAPTAGKIRWRDACGHS